MTFITRNFYDPGHVKPYLRPGATYLPTDEPPIYRARWPTNSDLYILMGFLYLGEKIVSHNMWEVGCLPLCSHPLNINLRVECSKFSTISDVLDSNFIFSPINSAEGYWSRFQLKKSVSKGT